MASLSTGGGLGNILDSAVKTAVTHLASSPAGIDRSRVDFLYYDDGSPPYYDYYYDDHDDHQYLDDDNIEPPTDSLISPPERNYKPPNPPGWTKHLHQSLHTGSEKTRIIFLHSQQMINTLLSTMVFLHAGVLTGSPPSSPCPPSPPTSPS